MTETVTIELSERQLDLLLDCVRWQRDLSDQRGHRRVYRKVKSLHNELEDQTSGVWDHD